jgi:phosphoglucosamine mutase
LVNVCVKQKRPIEELTSVQLLVAQAQEKLKGEGRVLVRYSGTESKVRVMVEGPTDDLIRNLAEEIAAELERSCSV